MSHDSFDVTPKVKKRLNVLPDNPEKESPFKIVQQGRFPSWLHRKLPKGSLVHHTGVALQSGRLPTVCEEARCPNLLECWSKKTATFLVMGKECTRNCGFCSIDFSKAPQPLEDDEGDRLAQACLSLGLKHVVITMVARDDLEDGGAKHLAKIVRKVKESSENSTVEVLTSDFFGNERALDLLLEAPIDIFNHNIETVRELTPRVRHKATYERTLNVLNYVHKSRPSLPVKSGLMVGLGETKAQIYQTLHDLKDVGCTIVTIGQYLQSDIHKLRVKAFIPPSEFDDYASFGNSIGIPKMYCGPFVRSSYHAETLLKDL